MTLFIKIENNKGIGDPIVEQNLKYLYPTTNFPQFYTPQFVEALGYGIFIEKPKPSKTKYQKYIAGDIVRDESGLWYQSCSVADMTDQEKQEVDLKEKELLKNSIINKTQIRLDQFARTREYDNVNSVGKYKDISDQEIDSLPQPQRDLVRKFRTESRYLSLMTASTWAKLYLILQEVESGSRPLPTGFEEIESELPALTWPV